jgi:hypothetical protein
MKPCHMVKVKTFRGELLASSPGWNSSMKVAASLTTETFCNTLRCRITNMGYYSLQYPTLDKNFAPHNTELLSYCNIYTHIYIYFIYCKYINICSSYKKPVIGTQILFSLYVVHTY